MIRWIKKLDLSDMWNPNMDEVQMLELGKSIAERLKVIYPEWEENEELCYIIDEFSDILPPEEIASGNYCFGSTTEHFNLVMGSLYDFADASRLWIQTAY